MTLSNKRLSLDFNTGLDNLKAIQVDATIAASQALALA